MQDEAAHWCEVMEFCPGGDLYAAIKKGGMSPSEVECCFKQILTGVSYLHSQGVAHRDIKPENFIVTDGMMEVREPRVFGEGEERTEEVVVRRERRVGRRMVALRDWTRGRSYKNAAR